MAYGVSWYHLDANNEVLSEHMNRACFAAIASNANFEHDCQYLEYDFGQKIAVSQAQATKYFHFIKSIPEFKELMPRSISQMVKSGRYKIDLHKFNGTKVFTILTLIRAVVEDPDIVSAVISFDRKKKYKLSNFSILKMCGSYYHSNSNHWITPRVDKTNLTTMFNNKGNWDSNTPCIETGLRRTLFHTFAFDNDSFAPRNSITEEYIEEVRQGITEQKQKYITASLQLGF